MFHGFSGKRVSGRGFFSNRSGCGKPDLIILDIMLPGEEGVELLKFLKENPDTCKIPVIMATAKGMEYDKDHSLDLGGRMTIW